MPPTTGTTVADYYKALQVDPGADPDVIEAAYRKLVFKLHPDRNPDPRSLERVKALNAARDILLDPDLRARYDEARRRGTSSEVRAGAPARAPRSASAQDGGPDPGPGDAGASTVLGRRRQPRKLGRL